MKLRTLWPDHLSGISGGVLKRSIGLAAVFIAWHRFRIPTSRRIHITLRVIQSDGCDLTASPDNESTDGRKNQTDNKQSR